MDDAPLSLGIATVLAFLAGIVGVLRRTLPALLLHLDLVDLDAGTLSTITVVAAAVALAVSPVATFVVGYLWGNRADVRSGYVTLTGLTGASALFGYVVASVLVFATAFSGTQQLLPNVLAIGVGALEVLSVPLSVLAGGAIAHFRTTERERDRPTRSRTDDGADRDPAVDRSEREPAFE